MGAPKIESKEIIYTPEPILEKLKNKDIDYTKHPCIWTYFKNRSEFYNTYIIGVVNGTTYIGLRAKRKVVLEINNDYVDQLPDRKKQKKYIA